MRPKSIFQTGVGISAPYIVDYSDDNFQIGLMVAITGTVTASIEATCDNLLSTTYMASISNNPTWVPLAGLSAITANTLQLCETPIYAVRINQTAGTGTTRLAINQSNHV